MVITITVLVVLLLLYLPPTIEKEDITTAVANIREYNDFYRQEFNAFTAEGFINALDKAKISTVLGAVGPSLQAIGMALQFIPSFLQKPEPAMHKLLKDAFSKMDLQVSNVYRMFNALKHHKYLAESADAYSPIHKKLQDLKKLLTASGNTNRTLSSFRDACRKKSDGLVLLNDLAAHAKSSGSHTDAKSAFNAVKSDLRGLETWFQLLLNEILQAAATHVACVGVHTTGTTDINNATKSAKRKIRVVLVTTLAAVQQLKSGYVREIAGDVQEVAKEKASQSNSQFTNSMTTFLKEKYYWIDYSGFSWFVVAYNIKGSYDTQSYSQCSGAYDSCVSLRRVHGRGGIFVAWCNMSRPVRAGLNYTDAKKGLKDRLWMAKIGGQVCNKKVVWSEVLKPPSGNAPAAAESIRQHSKKEHDSLRAVLLLVNQHVPGVIVSFDTLDYGETSGDGYKTQCSLHVPFCKLTSTMGHAMIYGFFAF